MGRKSKQPVSIMLTDYTNSKDSSDDGLPKLVSFIDIPFDRQAGKFITRVFLKSPSTYHVSETVLLRELVGQNNMVVHGARMPYMNMGVKISPNLYEYCFGKGLDDDFINFLIRLITYYFRGKRMAADTVGDKLRAMRDFIDFLATRTEFISNPSIVSLNKEFWLAYLERAESAKNLKYVQFFNDVRAIFKNYAPTSLNGWLSNISVAKRNLRPSYEHTSEFVDASYSDSVMYQILALCLERFQRRIGYLKRYVALSETDMPDDWLNPDYESKLSNRERKIYEEQTLHLLIRWLNDENEGYQILIDHFILQHKAGLIKSTNSRRFWGGIVRRLDLLSNKPQYYPLINEFRKTTAFWHDFIFPRPSRSIWYYYIKKESANEINPVINQIAWCLANLLMMQTGINREVALSIPSRSDDGESILIREDSLFVSKQNKSREIEIYGFKERGGEVRKKIPISIPKHSPLYEMLVDYAKYVKVNFTGPFFELSTEFMQNWNQAGGIADFTYVYPIFDDNGNQLTSINTTMFRKVFATGQLLERIKGCKNGNDLADAIRSDLHHGNLDTTLSHYLMKTDGGRAAIDIAIATITADKLNEALHFKGKVIVSENRHVTKNIYLCECEDPTNPSHDVAFADECRHYDLCLGCERSIVTKFHLPYICARILQYEKERISDPHIWPATFEDLWVIAHDSLDQYKKSDPKNGPKLVEEAWQTARDGGISLPPIIKSIGTKPT